MANKTGGNKKRRRTPQESVAQRNRSFNNKTKQRKDHALRHPNDKKSLASATRWTAESQKSQRTSATPTTLPKGK